MQETLYQERKLAAVESGQCLRSECAEPMADDSLYCPAHRDARKAAKAKVQARLRRRRRRERVCIDCGGERPRGQQSCEACRVARNRVPKRVRDTTAEQQAKADRVAAATRKHADGRTRYHGQRKKGNQPRLQLDTQDITSARSAIDKGEAGLRWYETEEVQALPRIQREDVKSEALHRLNQAIGLLEDVMDRRGFFKADRPPDDGDR